MRKSLQFLCFSALFAAGVAQAEQSFFIDGSVGRASLDGFDDEPTVFRFGGGWRFNPYFGVELGYQDLGESEVDVAIGGSTPRIEADGAYAGLNLRVPVTAEESGFAFGARAGVLFWDAEGRSNVSGIPVSFTDSGNDFYVGISGGWDFSPQFGLALAYDRYEIGDDSDSDSNFDVYSLKGEFRF